MNADEFEEWFKRCEYDAHTDGNYIVTFKIKSVEPIEDRDFLMLKYSEYLTP
jgi:hypothetical protein